MRQGELRQAGHGATRLGPVRHGRRDKAGSGMAWSGMACSGKAGLARRGRARIGAVRQVWIGGAGSGSVGQA